MVNIALCDDMPIMREILELHLREYESQYNMKFNINHFDSGEDLIDSFNKNMSFFNLFFLDNHMKKLTGLDTALYIRRFNQKPAIVFVTSSNMTDDLDITNTTVTIKVLKKPVQKHQVFEVLRQFLQQ